MTTLLDAAYEAMSAAPEDVAKRMAFFERLAESELFLMLQQEADGDQVTPETFDVAGGTFILVFDREERLADFAGKTVPYIALSGRALVQMIASLGVGLGVNFGAVSETLISSDEVVWFAQTVQEKPDEVQETIVGFEPLGALPEGLLEAIDRKLTTAAGLADAAILVAVRYDNTRLGHLMAIINAQTGAEHALAQAMQEVLTFSGLDAAGIDVAFYQGDHAHVPIMARLGMRFDLPHLHEPKAVAPSAPGMDPDKPPKLR
jgi:hypothetical protein